MAEENSALMYAMGRDTAANAGGCFGGMNGWGDLAALLVVAGIFGGGWGGFGGFGGGGGAQQNYVLASDFATIQRQLSDGFGGVERRTDAIINGICDSAYTNAQLINGVNANIANLGYELQKCCCENQRAIDGVNYNMSINTRDIIQSQEAGTRAILEKMCQYEIEAKNTKIAEQQATINALNLAASQQAQNAYLIGQLRPCPVPAYQVANPYCNCNCGNGNF